jgi:hypothetical protein
MEAHQKWTATARKPCEAEKQLKLCWCVVGEQNNAGAPTVLGYMDDGMLWLAKPGGCRMSCCLCMLCFAGVGPGLGRLLLTTVHDFGHR